jgi:hypothetical protein
MRKKKSTKPNPTAQVYQLTPRKPTPQPKKIEAEDYVVIDGAEHLGAFLVLGVDDEGASLATIDNRIPLEELRHSTWEGQPKAEEQPDQPIANLVHFPFVTARRLGALTTAQHEEIARLIKSSMDSTTPTPALTPQARSVVEREIDTLAQFAFVRRTKNHYSTFTRALVAWERRLADTPFDPNDACRQRIESEGRRAIENLWRWLHGYVAPVEPEVPQAADRPRGFFTASITDVIDTAFTLPWSKETRRLFDAFKASADRDAATQQQSSGLVDFQCWKQSHARPIRTCAVKV